MRRDVLTLAGFVRVADDFVELSRRKRFDLAWTEAFLDAMNADLSWRAYDGVDEVLGSIYGSAEVFGLFMARIMNLPDESLPYARLLGRAMQYINFIRDIDEELHLGLYNGWQEEAGKGLAMIPRRYRIPICTASDMYRWTANRIDGDPWIVFKKRKVKPGKSRIVQSALGNAMAG
jgi:phytoene synthase